MNKNRNQKSFTIFAYGFDILGFALPTDNLRVSNETNIRFVKFEQQVSLEESDGVIIPQGIFEKIKIQPTAIETYTDVKVMKNLLLEREREIINLIRNNKWVCFLVRKIIDKVPQGFANSESIKNTDLCKRMLNMNNIERSTADGITVLNSKTNEFINFVQKYGVANTIFDLSYVHRNIDLSVLVTSGRSVVGIEVMNRLFFLPFHTTRTDSETLEDIAKITSTAIIDYRQKREFILPTWLDEFQFESEKALKLQIDEYLEKAGELQSELEIWKNYKSIITTSGDRLRKVVMGIMKDFFQFKIDPIDEGREDFKILNENNETLFIVEVKGTKKGIKREHINQVDSHRERNSLPDSIPGILIINNEMGVDGIENKLNTTVADEQIAHAKRLNILIFRTIDLMFLIKSLEKENENRKNEMIKFFNSGGGWLKANYDGISIIT